MDENIWLNDKLGRKDEAQELLGYLKAFRINKPTKHLVLNIDAEWGFGKTYMLENMYQQLQSEGVPCAFYDAWSNDFSNEPMVSFILEVQKSLDPFIDHNERRTKSLEKIVLGTIKIGAGALVKKYLNLGAEELEEISKISIAPELVNIAADKAKEIIDKHSEKQEDLKTTIRVLRSELKKLANSFRDKDKNPLPLVIFIDELDRCRPNYAIELLESIKHIFEVEGVFFVIATDTRQLANAFNAVYGNNYDTKRYLKRFFDMEYQLKDPDSTLYVTMLFNEFIGNLSEKAVCQINTQEHHLANLAFCFSIYAKAFNLSYRDQEQCVQIFEAILLMYNESRRIQFLFMMPLIIISHKSPDALVKIKRDLQSKHNIQELSSYFTRLDDDFSLNIDRKISFKENENIFVDTILLSYLVLYNNNDTVMRQAINGSNFQSIIANSLYGDGRLYDFPLRHISSYPDLITTACRYAHDHTE